MWAQNKIILEKCEVQTGKSAKYKKELQHAGYGKVSIYPGICVEPGFSYGKYRLVSMATVLSH